MAETKKTEPISPKKADPIVPPVKIEQKQEIKKGFFNFVYFIRRSANS